MLSTLSRQQKTTTAKTAKQPPERVRKAMNHTWIMPTDLEYKWCGEYMIPDLTLKGCEQKPLGKYGRMRKRYLQEHRTILWNRMILNGTLDAHLRETDTAANRQIEQILIQTTKAEGVNERLKENEPMRWVQEMNVLRAQAEEQVLRELVFG
jgi:hypothetical protein